MKAISVCELGCKSDALASMSGMIRGLPADLSVRMGEYLRETFDAKKTPRSALKGPSRVRARR